MALPAILHVAYGASYGAKAAETVRRRSALQSHCQSCQRVALRPQPHPHPRAQCCTPRAGAPNSQQASAPTPSRE
eukprot:12027004-Alexandrium_andersonii.AAC.1